MAVSFHVRSVFLGVLALAFPSSAEAQRTSRKIDDFALRDYLGKEHSLSDLIDRKIVVVAFLGTECPLAAVYGAQLSGLVKNYESRDVVVLGVNSNRQDTPTEIGHYVRTHSISFPMLKDPGNVVADQFSAKRTPEVFLLDETRTVRYHGRIDDQFGVGYARPGPKRSYLVRAIDQLLAGKPVSEPETLAVGCHIGRIQQTPSKGNITYANQISRLVARHCIECHREGGIAPFALQCYEDVSAWAETLCEVIEDERMPPWHANPKHGDFANESRMVDSEKSLLNRWVENGMPRGDDLDLPRDREFASGWALGSPDKIVKMPVPIKVSPTGVMDYQYVTIDPGFTEDKWVRASEIRPGVRSVVHHIIVFVNAPGADPILKEQGVGFETVGGFVPGAPPMELPDGIARFIPAGSKFVMQIHYTPDGTERMDQSEIGLYFSDPGSVRRTMQTGVVANLDFTIPAGEKNYRVESVHRFSNDMEIHSLQPHMHYRGKSFRYELAYPNGSREILLDIPRYDFNWQNSYRFSKPKFVPEGSLLKCVAYFDNSEQNLSNPDSTVSVRWGEQTWEEMMIGFFDAVFLNQDLSIPEPTLTPIGNGRYHARFQFRPDRPTKSVHLAGTFNDWNNGSHPMVDDDGDGIFTAELVVDAGDYRYKFVIDRDYWTHDPASRTLTGFLHESYFVAGDEVVEESL